MLLQQSSWRKLKIEPLLFKSALTKGLAIFIPFWHWIKSITRLVKIEYYSWAEWPRTRSQTTLASDLAVVAALNIQANYGL